MAYERIVADIRATARRLSYICQPATDAEAVAIYAAAYLIESLLKELDALQAERNYWEREYRNA